jgi:hypothetical protein
LVTWAERLRQRLEIDGFGDTDQDPHAS